MRIVIVCPARAGSRSGNRATALRWQRMLRELGHEARIIEEISRQTWDLVVALHAVKSAKSVERARQLRLDQPIVVAMTGTDLYGELAEDPARDETLRIADRIIVLHPGAEKALPKRERSKVRFVPQSAPVTVGARAPSPDTFDVTVVGHLRDVKDPFRAALASRNLPADSRVRIVHVGGAMTEDMEARARLEARENRRYLWVGDVTPIKARRLMASSRLLVLSSKLEGGANVLSEAIADGVPVLASRIPCSVGLLGEKYAGFFPVGNTEKLSRLLMRAERDAAFLALLTQQVEERRPITSLDAEIAAWRRLLAELTTVQ